jgi:hypothetical protein
VYWQSLTDQPETIHPTFYAVQGKEKIALHQGMTYPAETWIKGELVREQYRWPLPVEMPAGEYTLVMEVARESLFLGQLTVVALNRKFSLPEMAYRIDITWAETVILRGFDVTPSPDTLLERGQPIDLTLIWQLQQPTDLPLTVFVHLAGPDNINYDQRDMQPRQNTYPVALWVADEVVSDTYQLALPDNAPAGTYELRVGWYLQENGQRLSIVNRDGEVQGDYWVLALFRVPPITE